MENDPNKRQTDFLGTLDTNQSGIVTGPPISGPSASELKLEQLLKQKEALSTEMDICSLCDGRSRGECGQNHKQKWKELLEEIDQVELDIRG